MPYNAKKKASRSNKKHIVLAGENIISISKLYSINKKEIIDINNLINPDFLYPGQVLILPKTAQKEVTEDLDFHVISRGDTLYKISKYYNKSIEDLISINDIYEPDILKPGTKVFLKSSKGIISKGAENSNNKSMQKSFSKKLTVSTQKNSSDEWRSYGPLEINWSRWSPFEGSLVTPAIHNNGNPLLLAINCNSSKLTWRASKGNWKKWLAPQEEFEFTLLDQLCKNTNEIQAKI